jgi:hypothetical protein
MKLFLLIPILIVTATFSSAQESSAKQKVSKCLVDDWAFEVYVKPSFLGFKEAPAKIIAIWNPDFRDGRLNDIVLRNESGKNITAVKIKWFIYRVEKVNDKLVLRKYPPTVIVQNETSSIETGEFKLNEDMDIHFPLGRSCRDIYDTIIKSDEQEGGLWLEHIISEITYADGSKWTQ